MIADWEYGTQVASWDQLISQEEMERRLRSFNSVNNNKNVVGFQWAFYKITERLSKAMKRCGWPEANIIQWAALHVFKKEHLQAWLGFCPWHCFSVRDGGTVTPNEISCGQRSTTPDANVLFAMEGPKAKKDAAANIINPARNPWQVIYDFLQQFGTGGRIFSMMAWLPWVKLLFLWADTRLSPSKRSHYVEGGSFCSNWSHCWVTKPTKAIRCANLTFSGGYLFFTCHRLDSRIVIKIEKRRQKITYGRSGALHFLSFMYSF